MRKYIIPILLGILLSFFIFPVFFRFLPSSLNTKKILAGIGIALFAWRCIQDHAIRLSRRTIISALIAVLFSIWCLFCITANGTNDDTYASYWISFATWLGGAYCVCFFMRARYGRIDLSRMTYYLAALGVAQCIIALLNDNIPAFKNIVDRLIQGGPEYYDAIDRMYGFGAALDSAGIAFSVILVLIAHQISFWKESGQNKTLYPLLIAYIIITVVGNMIARTTIIGAGAGFFYIFISYFYLKRGGVVTTQQIRFFSVLLILLTIAVTISVILYNSDPDFRSNIRFAFEGFFNWAETGEFRTDSTDKLNAVMWIWPQDTRSWIIGTGIFGHFVYATDIGYCRLTLYCGLIGMGIFSIYFIYNHLSLINKFRRSWMLALLLIALTFIIWLKVATDIFFIDALLFCLDGDEMPDEETETEAEKEEGLITT